MLDPKFTDNDLKVLYRDLLAHYQHLSSTSVYTVNAIYDEMFKAVQYKLESPFVGSLSHLPRGEKARAYHAFNVIFYALPIYNHLSLSERQDFKPNKPAYNPKVVYQIPPCYHTNDTLLTWLMLSTLIDRSSYRGNFGGSYFPAGSGHHHGHRSVDPTNKSKGDVGEALAGLVLVLILAAVAAAAFIALYYMLSQVVDSVERVWFNEGWLKAAMMLATSVGVGAATSGLLLTIGAPLLVALAATAGFNPVAVVIVATVCLTVVGAGLATLATSLIYDSISKSKHKDAIDPSDALRFRLTRAEESKLVNQGIDPMRVKCAIVALRAEIAKVSNSESTVPSYLSRHLFGGKSKRAVQPLLDKVRDLRSGKLATVEVGGLMFDCNVPPAYVYQPPSYAVFAASVPHAEPKTGYVSYLHDILPDGYADVYTGFAKKESVPMGPENRPENLAAHQYSSYI